CGCPHGEGSGALEREVAADLTGVAAGDEGGLLLPASGLGVGAALAEAAAGGKIKEAGDDALDGGEPLAVLLLAGLGDRLEERLRVRVARGVEEVADGGGLDDAPGVHHQHAVADLGDDA